MASETGPKDLPLTRIPRVSATESKPPQASGSSYSRSSHRDRTRPTRQPVFLVHETTIQWTAPGAAGYWKPAAVHRGALHPAG